MALCPPFVTCDCIIFDDRNLPVARLLDVAMDEPAFDVILPHISHCVAEQRRRCGNGDPLLILNGRSLSQHATLVGAGARGGRFPDNALQVRLLLDSNVDTAVASDNNAADAAAAPAYDASVSVGRYDDSSLCDGSAIGTYTCPFKAAATR